MIRLETEAMHPLERGRAWRAKKSEAFVINSMAKLIHRPRYITFYRGWKKPHIAIGLYCGNSFTGSKKFTMTSKLNSNQIVCARCEEVARLNGLPSSSEIVGSHVCIGGVRAFSHCCNKD